MTKVIHRSDKRGVAEHGWLHSRHSFSFADYYDPDKMSFGLLRVLNDDIVEPGQGFGSHPHNNMEIISIVLSGSLAHRDSMGSSSQIKEDEVQVMSAGTGIMHSEFNESHSEPVNFLQLWIFPKEKDIAPRYDQKSFLKNVNRNKIVTLVSGNDLEGSLYIHQNAVIDSIFLDSGKEINRQLVFENNGMYVFVISGAVKIDNDQLNERDALGLHQHNEITIKALEDSRILIIEVPMN